MNTPKLGFRQLPDPRDEKYPLAKIMGVPKERPVSKSWKTGPTLDQKQTNACVGFTAFQFQMSEPVAGIPKMTPMEIYADARRIDEFPGEADEGTSVRAGLEVLRRNNIISGFYWATNAREAMDYLLKFGPLIFGTPWTERMFHPDSNGIIRPHGANIGGHAWFGYAAQWDAGFITGLTSWGLDFGKHGSFKISVSDVEELFQRGGVAAAVLEP